MRRRLLAAHQCDLLPYTGFWWKLLHADIFDVAIWDQINWKGYTARVKMHGNWVSLPTTNRSSEQRISGVRLHQNAADELCRAVIGKYQGAPFWKDRGDQIRFLIDESRDELLWRFNLSLLLSVRDMLGITTPMAIAPVPTFAKTEGIEQLCERYQVSDYLAGTGSKAYLDEKALRAAKVWTHWSTHDPWTEDSILTTLFEKEDPMAWVRKEIG